MLSLNKVVQDLGKLLARAIGERIELTTRLAEALWPVLADADQLAQVLLNLSVNARDAMPDGGPLAHRDRQRRARHCPAGPRHPRRPLRDARGEGRRLRHERGGPLADLRPVLHDEGDRHGARARDRLRHRAPGGRRSPGRLEAGGGRHLHRVPAGRRRADRARPGRRRGGRAARPRGDGRARGGRGRAARPARPGPGGERLRGDRRPQRRRGARRGARAWRPRGPPARRPRHAAHGRTPSSRRRSRASSRG